MIIDENMVKEIRADWSVTKPVLIDRVWDLIDTTEALWKVARAAERLDKHAWFDPALQGIACITCEANLHPNCMGKHEVIEGTGCDLDKLHTALATLNLPSAPTNEPPIVGPE